MKPLAMIAVMTYLLAYGFAGYDRVPINDWFVWATWHPDSGSTLLMLHPGWVKTDIGGLADFETTAATMPHKYWLS